jgi:hypothetical protein
LHQDVGIEHGDKLPGITMNNPSLD